MTDRPHIAVVGSGHAAVEAALAGIRAGLLSLLGFFAIVGALLALVDEPLAKNPGTGATDSDRAGAGR